MKRNIKKIPLFLLSLSMFTVSCGSGLPEELQNKITNNSIVIPATDKGGISGTVRFTLQQGQIPPETTVKVVGSNGKVLGSSKISDNGSFYFSNLPPGEVSIIFQNSQTNSEIKSNITAGKVTSLKTIDFQTSNNGGGSTSLAITGKVVNSDGTPVADARISDVTGGFINNFTTTNNEGDFNLSVTSFTDPRSLEVTAGNLTTSLTVNPEQIDNLTIPLIPNSRIISGTVKNSVVKNENIEGVKVQIPGTNISTLTNKDGQFKLRGAPITPINLEFGNKDGFINTRENVEASSTSEEVNIGDVLIQPIGNLIVNLTVEDSPIYNSIFTKISGDCTNIPDGFGYTYTPIQETRLDTFCYYNNAFRYPSLNGSIQLKGTTITKSFVYPATPTISVKRYISETESDNVKIYERNFEFSVPLNNIPGGEYDLSVSLPFHEVQKSIKVVIPSNDTITTEMIELKRIIKVESIGDISGKVIFTDKDNNPIAFESGVEVRVVVLRDSVKLDDFITLSDGTTVKTIDALLSSNDASVFSLIRDRVTTSSEGTYNIRNVATGTRMIIAGVVSSEGLNSNFLPSPYTLLNVESGVINNAPDIRIMKR